MTALKQLAAIGMLALASTTAYAIPMTSSVGSVNVLGTLYNVDILYDSLAVYNAQSFNALNPTITFTTEAAATAAVIALNAAFPGFDWIPAQLDKDYTGTRVAYSLNADNYQFVTIYDGGAPFGPADLSRNDGNFFSFAQFTAVGNEVPEPVSLALFGLGMAGLAWSRRKA